MRNFDALPLADRGYVFAGLVESEPGNAVMYPCIWRVDCQGRVLWAKFFNAPTESANNAAGRVLPVGNGDFALVASMGFFFTSPLNDILVARVDGGGNSIWAKRFGGGSGGQDVANAACATKDGGLVIAGKTNSHGSDAGNGNYTDQYFLKISDAGAVVWSRTIGNSSAVDRAYDIAELPDGSLVAAGSYLHNGTFHANWLKMDAGGQLLWHRGMGESVAPQANHAYGILPTADGGFLLTGSSTNLQANFQGFGDFLVVKTGPDGIVQWSRVYSGGGPDSFENAVNAAELPSGNFAVACATASFPTSGFVPNKWAILEVDPGGVLKKAKAYNEGYSHYPRIVRDPFEQSWLLNGFSNSPDYGSNGNRFDAVLANLDAGLGVDDCLESNFTFFAQAADPAFELVEDLPEKVGTGAAVLPTIIDASDFSLLDTTICEKDGYADCAPFSSVEKWWNEQPTGFEVWPNPAEKGQPVSIRWAEKRVNLIEIFDASGRLVSRHRPAQEAQNMDLRLEAAGVFFVSLRSRTGVLTEKLVVR